MRILYVSQYFPPEPGAPAARVSELARAWKRAGHDVTVVTGLPNHPTGRVPDEYRYSLGAVEDYEGVCVVRTWLYATPNRGRVRRSFSYASFASSAVLSGLFRTERPDVVLATSPQFLCAVSGQALSWLHRVPFVLEIRDMWPESIVAVGALAAGHPVVRALTVLERGLYDAADEVVVVTDAFRQRLLDRGVPARKVSVIKNGVDLDRFRAMPRDTALRGRLGFGDRCIVSYVGTHGMAHALDSVLDAARLLLHRDGIRFLFVGEGAERAKLQARSAEEKLHNVRFLGALSRDAMNEVYATSDICLVPLRKNELFTTVIPSKIFEIMAAARPIVLSVDGEARDIIERAGAGVYVAPEDGEGMAAAIDALAADPTSSAAIGQRGREFVAREFDRSVLAARYLGILGRVASEGRA